MFKKIIHQLYTVLVYPNYKYSKKIYDKFIFIHPAQSGGNTVDYFFKINFGLRNYKINQHDDYKIFNFESKEWNEFFLIFGHFTYEFALRKKLKKNYFYFTSIRDPKNRFLSNYYRNKNDFEKNGDKYMSLEEFLEYRLSQGLDNYYVRFFSSEKIYAKKSIKISNEHFLDSLENLKKLNFIFFIDDMKKNLKEFKKNFKLVLDMTKFFNLHKNKVSNSIYPNISSKESKLLSQLTEYDTKLYDAIKKNKS